MLKKALTRQTVASIFHLIPAPQRSFSRAEILASLDKTKVDRRHFVKRELVENPEFFKAFPHLQAILPSRRDEEKGSFVGETEKEFEKRMSEKKYNHEVLTGFKQYNEEEPYFDSLL